MVATISAKGSAGAMSTIIQRSPLIRVMSPSFRLALLSISLLLCDPDRSRVVCVQPLLAGLPTVLPEVDALLAVELDPFVLQQRPLQLAHPDSVGAYLPLRVHDTVPGVLLGLIQTAQDEPDVAGGPRCAREQRNLAIGNHLPVGNGLHHVDYALPETHALSTILCLTGRVVGRGALSGCVRFTCRT